MRGSDLQGHAHVRDRYPRSSDPTAARQVPSRHKGPSHPKTGHAPPCRGYRWHRLHGSSAARLGERRPPEPLAVRAGPAQPPAPDREGCDGTLPARRRELRRRRPAAWSQCTLQSSHTTKVRDAPLIWFAAAQRLSQWFSRRHNSRSRRSHARAERRCRAQHGFSPTSRKPCCASSFATARSVGPAGRAAS